MTTLVVAAGAALGVWLIYSRYAFGWTGVRRPDPAHGRRPIAESFLVQAGLGDVRWREVWLLCLGMAVAAGLAAFAVFGSPVPAVLGGLLAATAPPLSYRARRRRRRARAQEAWPRMLEELRVLVGATGISIPQALFQVGRRAPEELRPAFEAAHREWMFTTDFERSLAVLKSHLADATADAACETLLIAHEVGGIDIDRRLTDLADDRNTDVQNRKDARAKQAGARFARWFVLVSPLGMALVGLGLGTGRAAYQTPTGQVLVTLGIVLVAVCWFWAGRIMTLPDDERVFGEVPSR